MAAPLTDEERQRAYRCVVSEAFVERLDTTLGTAKVVTLLKDGGLGLHGSTSNIEGLPYGGYERRPDGGRSERRRRGWWWAFHLRRESKGFRVWVEKTRWLKGGEVETVVVREQFLTWTWLANQATFEALERKHALGLVEPRDPQLRLF